MDQSTQFNLDLIRRYDKTGPRYTSYPTAVEFHSGFDETEYHRQIALSNERGGPLSLYIHLPFCDTVCYFCACNKTITKNRKRAQPYLDHLYQEIAMQGTLFDHNRPVEQLHWGGGTPTFMNHEQMRRIMAVTRQHFNLQEDDRGEFSIEVDPRETQTDTMQLLREIGFNRVSLGVQDFNIKVQTAVNRIQTEAQTFAVLDAARKHNYRSVSVDLIYGLPLQTAKSFAVTLDKIIAAAPDRLSVFNYAHLPQLFKTQRQINEDELPSAAEKLDILQLTIDRLTTAGYIYIGMDHFAKPNDELAIAQRQNQLYRNFQGYSTHADCDLIGLGATSIGLVGDAYYQNMKEQDDYYQSLDNDRLPLFRGVTFDTDDRLRRAVIGGLICHFRLKFTDIEQAFSINFRDYFATELAALSSMVEDGLLLLSNEGIEVSSAGRLLIRNICMVFDRYLQQKAEQRQYSKVI